jgi:hypothetical protein
LKCCVKKHAHLFRPSQVPATACPSITISLL